MKIFKEKNKTTYVVFLLDDSVSMSGFREQTISGFNEQLEAVKQMELSQPGHEVLVSFATFSTPDSFKVIRRWVKASEVKPITLEDHKASGGSTALLDAMQGVIDLAKEYQPNIEKDKNAALILFFTDGQENASLKIRDGNVLKDQIEALRKTDHWTFTFTGTLEGAVVEKNYGISAANTMVFDGTAAGMTSFSGSNSASIANYSHSRSLGDTQSDNFYDNNPTDVNVDNDPTNINVVDDGHKVKINKA